MEACKKPEIFKKSPLPRAKKHPDFSGDILPPFCHRKYQI
jgi:hypothetical protein